MSIATKKYLLVAMSNSGAEKGKKSLKKKEVAAMATLTKWTKNAVGQQNMIKL